MLVSDLAFRGEPERLGSVTTADVLVVGSGPAGASAALLLARCRRSVVICDDGKPRNAASSRIHGLIPAADLTPATFREATRRSLSSYGEITCNAERVSRIEKQGSRFTYETHIEQQAPRGPSCWPPVSWIPCRRLRVSSSSTVTPSTYVPTATVMSTATSTSLPAARVRMASI